MEGIKSILEMSPQEIVMQELNLGVTSQPGWVVENTPLGPGGLDFSLRCPHGERYMLSISMHLLAVATMPQQMIRTHWQSIANRCLNEHHGKPFFKGHIGIDLEDDFFQHALFDSMTWKAPTPETPGGFANPSTITTDLYKLFPGMKVKGTPCPECSSSTWAKSLLGNLIVHLNDAHRWSREKIADWLDTLDIDLTVGPQQPDPLVVDDGVYVYVDDEWVPAGNSYDALGGLEIFVTLPPHPTHGDIVRIKKETPQSPLQAFYELVYKQLEEYNDAIYDGFSVSTITDIVIT